MMKGNVTNALPMILIGGWINMTFQALSQVSYRLRRLQVYFIFDPFPMTLPEIQVLLTEYCPGSCVLEWKLVTALEQKNQSCSSSTALTKGPMQS